MREALPVRFAGLLGKGRKDQHPRRSPSLPFELVQEIIAQMYSHDVWKLRRVCRAWREYIEHVLARSWLLGTWVTFENGTYEDADARALFRICDARHGARPAGAWPLLRRDARWLVYALPRRPVVPVHIAPPRHPNGRFLYAVHLEQEAKRARGANPEWANILLDGKIRVVPPPCAVYRSEAQPIKLHAAGTKKVRGGRVVGYELGMADAPVTLKIDWRVLLSNMFTPTREPRRTPGWGPAPEHR